MLKINVFIVSGLKRYLRPWNLFNCITHKPIFNIPSIKVSFRFFFLHENVPHSNLVKNHKKEKSLANYRITFCNTAAAAAAAAFKHPTDIFDF